MTPDERQWCLKELARQGCTHGSAYAGYDPIACTLYCRPAFGAACIRIAVTPAQIAYAVSASKLTTPAANKLSPESRAVMTLDYKTHILVATQSGGRLIVLQAWQHVPSQAEIDEVIAGNTSVGVTRTSYALVTPTGIW